MVTATLHSQRHVRANSGITFRPDANTVLWLPGQDDPQSATIRDRSGNGNDGTLANTTWVRNSKGLWGLDFNATTSIVTVSDAASIQNIFDGGGIIEAWVNPRSTGEGSAARILSKVWYWRVLQLSAGAVNLDWAVLFSDTDGLWRTTVRPLSINTYSHMVLDYDADATTNNPTLYINGVALTVGSGITESTTPIGTRTTDVGTDLTIGNEPTTANTWDGTGHLVRAYDSNTHIAQVVAHYQQERGLFGV